MTIIRAVVTILLFTNSLTLIAQNTYFGTVVEAETNAPIEGVILQLDQSIVATTNQKGQFSFKLYPKAAQTINFVHIAYRTEALAITNFSKNTTIVLKQKLTQLDEVVIGKKKFNKRKFIKSAVNAYVSSLRKTSYWSKINLQQIVKYRDTIQNYIETDANILMLGSNVNSYWHIPLLVPLEVRRTEDNKALLKVIEKAHNNPDDETLIGGYVMAESFPMYRFLEKIHPLTKKGFRNYDYTIEKTIRLDNEPCYLISYKTNKTVYIGGFSTKVIQFSGRGMWDIKGKVWISKTDLKLKKMTQSFSMSEFYLFGKHSTFNIDYCHIDGVIYPKHIYFKGEKNYDQNNRFISRRTSNSRDLFYESHIEFTDYYNLSATSFKDYQEKELNRSGLANYFFDSTSFAHYNDAYWKNRPIENSYFSAEVKTLLANRPASLAFKKGAAQEMDKIGYMNKAEYKAYKKIKNHRETELLKLMKRDLKKEN